MSGRYALLLGAAVPMLIPCGAAHAGVRVGIGVGLGWPGCWGPGPYYPYYYAPPPVAYYAPGTVAVPQAVVTAQPTVAPSPVRPADETAPPPRAVPTSAATSPMEPPTLRPVVAQSSDLENSPEAQRLLQALADPDEHVRADAATGLGRLKTARALDPLAATLAGDHSPVVRAAAARAMAIIADPRSLLALQRAVQGDPDNDVRRTAQFAMEVIASR